VAVALVWLSGDWRSPFYVFALTTLVLPATTLPLLRVGPRPDGPGTEVALVLPHGLRAGP
jgi:hypothetical protein